MYILPIVGEINAGRVTKVLEEIAELKKKNYPDILVWISSNGGDVESGFDIYDLLLLYPGKKTGIVWQGAKSMASFILQACDMRYATPHARILIHHISRRNVGLDVMRSRKRMKEVIMDVERKQSMMYTVYAKRTGKTIPEIRKACEKEEDMYPEQAKAFGLIDDEWDQPMPLDAEEKKK